MPIRILLLCLAALMVPQLAQAKLYKWVDENGEVHYTDKVPPQASSRGHKELNQRGLTVEQVQPAKTAEELAREEELKRLRSEQEALLREQKKKDETLLRTYRTEDEIAMTRNGKLAAIDAKVKVMLYEIKSLKETLSHLQSEAAAMELSGKKPDKTLTERIDKTRRQIEEAYAEMVRREQEKEVVNASFDKDLARYRVLRNLSKPQLTVEAARPRPNIMLETVVTCPDRLMCDRMWDAARTYSRRHATTRVQVDGNRILLFAPPRKDNDISLAVSRIRGYDPDKEVIFLDIQCKETPLGREFCQGDKVHDIRFGFRQAVTAAIKPQQQSETARR